MSDLDRSAPLSARPDADVLAGARRLVGVDDARALGLAQEELTRAEHDGDAHLAVQARLVVGRAALNLGQSELAYDVYGSALRLSRTLHSFPLLISALRGLANAALETGRPGEAIAHDQEGLALSRETGDRAAEARSLNGLGVAHDYLGDYGTALEYYGEALRLRDEAGDLSGKAASLVNIGCVWSELGEHERALHYFQEALALDEQHGTPYDVALDALNTAHALHELGRYTDALPMAERALSLARTTGAAEIQRSVLANLAESHLRRGDVGAALAHAREAERLAADGAAPRVEAALRCTLGEILLTQGDPTQAKEVLTEALALARRAGARQYEFEAYRHLAEVHARLGDFEAAYQHHRAFHDLEVSVRGERADRRARTLLYQLELSKMQDEARVARQQSEQFARHARESSAELNELRVRADELEFLARQDPLTGLPNRRHLQQHLEPLAREVLDAGGPLTVAFVDIDHFKKVNDEFSHDVGDEVLRRVATLLQTHTRETDSVVRYGGEEFLLLMPGTREDTAGRLCERLRELVEVSTWSTVRDGLNVTISVGFASARAPVTLAQARMAADTFLYEAKTAGRNRVRGGSLGPADPTDEDATDQRPG